MSRQAIIPRPRKPKQPSARDQRIFHQHTVDHVPQVKLAFDNHMSASRVSQIVGNVRAWWADASPRDGELDHGQRVRLERHLERERLEMLYGESLKLLREWAEESKVPGPKSKVEETESEDSGQKTEDRPKRDHASQRVQALKCAIRTTESLGKLAEREPAPPPEGGRVIRADHLYEDLMRRRREAEEEGWVPPTEKPDFVVYYVLRAMTGEPLNPVQPGSDLQGALAKIVEALVQVGAAGDRESAGAEGATERGREGERQPSLHPSAPPSLHPSVSPSSAANASAKVANVDRESLLAGCPEDVKAILAASGWPDRFYDQLPAAAAGASEATLAREKSADFSAPVGSACRAEPDAEPGVAPPIHISTPAEVPPGRRDLQGEEGRGIEVVGSPEWQIARKKWLAERDRRRMEELARKHREKTEREVELRALRAAAAQRRAWLEAGRVEW